jgi:2-dehydropantoate 2-reductase
VVSSPISSIAPISTVAVLGPGGVGGFLAAALARAGEPVTVIAREGTAAAITAHGIAVDSVRLGRFVAHPAAQTTLTAPVDVLFVATKAMALADALDRISPGAAGLVIPLLNGLDHMEPLRERFGRHRVAAGSIRIEADRPAPAEIVHTSPFLRIDLAADDPAAAARLPGVVELLERAEIPAQIVPGERQTLWSKLVRLNALSATTSAADEQIGFIRSDPEWRTTLLACIAEGAAVANADGAVIDPRSPLDELEAAHEGLGSSMQRDIAAGRTPELDAIQGSVMRAGARHGLHCPTVARLSAQIAARAGIAPPIV